MAWSHANACAKYRGTNIAVLCALRRFARGTCSKKEEEPAIKITIHQHMTTKFIDSIVVSYDLVKSQDKTLLYWETGPWFKQCDYRKDERWQRLEKSFSRRDLKFNTSARPFPQAF